MVNLIQNLAASIAPGSKVSPNGWRSFNCPACIHKGQKRPDSKGRGGLYLEANGGIRYHCFNCNFNASWTPGLGLSDNIKDMFTWMGASDKDIKEAAFFAFKLKETGKIQLKNEKKEDVVLSNAKLPDDARSFMDLASEENPPAKFLNALMYINERNENLIEWFPHFHWSPKMPERVIIPYYSRGEIYGWTARLIRDPKNNNELRYINNSTKHKFLCNADVIYKKHRNYVIIVEGVLDAFAIDGVSILGSLVSDFQQKNIEAGEKEIIVLPDRDEAGEKLVDKAIELGWSVSFPPFHKNEENVKIKDALDAVNYYGQLMTIKLILENKEDNPLVINVKRKEWFK